MPLMVVVDEIPFPLMGSTKGWGRPNYSKRRDTEINLMKTKTNPYKKSLYNKIRNRSEGVGILPVFAH